MTPGKRSILLASFTLALTLFYCTALPVQAFPWRIFTSLGKASGSAAVKGAGAAAKGAGAAKLGGAAAKVGAGKAASMSAVGATAAETALGGKAVSGATNGLGSVADDIAAGGSKTAALGGLSDDGGRALGASSEAMGEASGGSPIAGSADFIKSEKPNVPGNLGEHAVDAADLASNVSSVDINGDSEDGETTAPSEAGLEVQSNSTEMLEAILDWRYLLPICALLFGAGFYLNHKSRPQGRKKNL